MNAGMVAENGKSIKPPLLAGLLLGARQDQDVDTRSLEQSTQLLTQQADVLGMEQRDPAGKGRETFLQ